MYFHTRAQLIHDALGGRKAEREDGVLPQTKEKLQHSTTKSRFARFFFLLGIMSQLLSWLM